jgi:hypothetical protein
VSGTIFPFREGTAELCFNQETFEGSGQVVTAPEPVGGEPEQERFAGSPRVGGWSGPLTLGAANKSRRRGGVGASLDSKENNRNGGFCGRYTIHGPVEHDGSERWRYAPLWCGSWTCARCGP